jgi:hypothetical protein
VQQVFGTANLGGATADDDAADKFDEVVGSHPQEALLSTPC